MSIAAFFDIDGTITHTSIIHPLIWYRRAHLSRWRFAWFVLGMLLCAPYYLWVDRRSRSRFNDVFYRRYAGLPVQHLQAWHRRTFPANLQPTIFPAALDCIRDHQRQGHRIVLVTGALDFVMQPLTEYLHADDLIANHVVDHDGVLTGELDGPAIADDYKAMLVHARAQRHGVDLGRSFAYGDSFGDAPMLACVGHAVAVNGDHRLRQLAVARGWRTVEWRSTR